MPRIALAALASILALAAGAASAQGPQRYALDVSVVRDGVQVVGAHGLIQEDGTSEISISDGDAVFQLNAELAPVQGDGEDDRLALFVTITHGDGEAQQPSLILKRGGTARVQIGEHAADGAFDGLTLDLTPAPQPR